MGLGGMPLSNGVRERAPEPFELRLCEGEFTLGVRTREAVLVFDSAREGCVVPELVASAGPSIAFDDRTHTKGISWLRAYRSDAGSRIILRVPHGSLINSVSA